ECAFTARLDLAGFFGRRVASHAARALPALQDAKTRNPDPLAFLEMLGDQAHEVAEDRLALALREFVIGRQPRRQMLERNGTAGLGTHWCRRFARHDGLPSSEARNAQMLGDMIRDRKESDLCALSGQNTGVFAIAPDAASRFAACTLAAHFGIDPGTKQNHNGNVVPREEARWRPRTTAESDARFAPARGSR